jgi:GMP synthase-like glutamine amidotransferase
MTVYVAQHVPFEGPGAIAPILESRGHRLVILPLYDGALDPREGDSAEPSGSTKTALPAPSEIDAWVSMGGPMSVHDRDVYPWIVPEQEVIRELHRLNRPVLGVCLGAQQIATALGGAVTPSPEVEIGWFPVRWSQEYRAFLGPAVPEVTRVLHWHGEMAAPPPGSVPVGASQGCPFQGFFYPEGATVGLQFHLEMDSPAIEAILGASRDELARNAGRRWVQDEAEIRRGARESAAETVAILTAVIEKAGL